jgi:hypothetical protein
MLDVEYTDEFVNRWRDLAVDEQEAMDNRVMLLAEHGPGLREQEDI